MHKIQTGRSRPILCSPMSGRGGARVSSGPSPDPNALRRDRPSDRTEWTRLPAAGRESEPPTWPLIRATARELAIWAEEWRRPQAIMWSANGQEREVALYVRQLVTAEKSKAPAIARTLVRQYMDDLGISLPGLRRHRWIIDAAPEERQAVRTDDTDHRAAKARLRSISGGAA